MEGAYACHPDLWAYYDLRVFLTVDPETQMSRIEARSGPEKAQQFRDRWIPFEEKYFKAFDVQARCRYVLQRDNSESLTVRSGSLCISDVRRYRHSPYSSVTYPLFPRM